MRILLVGPGLRPIPPPGWGAVEEVVWQLYRQFKARGHEAEILNEADISDSGLDFERFNVIHCHWRHQAAVLAERGIPYIYTSHIYSNYVYLDKNPVERAAVENSKLYLALHQRMVGPGQRSVVVGNGVDCDFFRPDLSLKRGDTLLCVSGIRRRKRVDWAIEVAERLPGMRLAVVGPDMTGEDAAEGQRLRACTEDQNVDWVGEVDKAEMRRWYQKSDALLFASREEAFALVPMEAMACGTPVVASPEHGHDYRGTRVAGSPAGMASEVGHLLRAGAFYSRAVRAMAKRYYDWSVVAAKILSAYQSVT